VIERILGARVFRDYRFWLIVLTVGVLAMKIAIIPYPWPELPPEECINPPLNEKCALIFDEAHYIPAARKLLRGKAVNNEHPPLSKALMILGILVFGDNPYGWRTLITITGAISIFFLGRIGYEISRDEKIALVSASLFAFDISSFNLSSIAMLDAPAMMFCLISTLLFLKKRWMWSGIAMGLALLSKMSSLFVLIALIVYKLFHDVYVCEDFFDGLRSWLKAAERTAIPAFIVMMIGLGVYDYIYGEYPTPFEHLDYMLSYHSSLTFKEGDVVYMPLSWTNPLKQFPRMPYYTITVEVDGKKYQPIAYYGMQTPLWWMTWLVAAFSAYFSYLDLRDGRYPSMEFFILVWFAANYLIYFPAAHILHRWVYPFYFYMTVPVIALGLPRVLLGEKISEIVLYLILAFQIAWFIVWFPVKPQWLIDLLLILGITTV